MSKFGIGQPVRRVEDQRFITGQGRYTDDINLPGQAYGYVLRSPTAHARIASLDVAAAKAAPGVLLVVTAAELDAAHALPDPDHQPRRQPSAPTPSTRSCARTRSTMSATTSPSSWPRPASRPRTRPS